MTLPFKVVADAITANPFEYNEAILGRSPEAYANWILQKNSWGGAIELAIFSNHFKRGMWKKKKITVIVV